MAKRFKFNHETLSFDEVRHSVLSVLRKTVLYIFVSALFLIGYYFIFAQFFSTPKEKKLEETNKTLSKNLAQINQRYDQLDEVMNSISQRDVNIYRRIFEVDPPNLKTGAEEFNTEIIENESNMRLTRHTTKGINELSKEVARQTTLLKQIVDVSKKNPSLTALPAIQPVDNKDLRRTAATYGMRIHPFYKVLKMHTGVDFAAPLGSNVYATGSGKVVKISNSPRNTGISITIDHSNGYKTCYNHLLKTLMREGQSVKRGDVIAMVGNSGRSVAPHLHYEVWYRDQLTNPLHYFFKDLTPAEYQRIKELAANKGQSLD
ncbi:MAG: M23 family metallopeptidase [Prevotellaceae bacterium]|jgi:murein DD-endopeptidase MepM/ murein hydrolase activator NlpD|nr:M23 family metallopeptidase [Prevotellaceae bacterium]